MQPWTRRVSKLAQQTVSSLKGHAQHAAPSPVAMPKALAADRSGDVSPDLFVNPISEGADPSVVRDGDRFLWCQAEGNVGVSIWESDRLTSMGTRHVVWMAEPEGPCSKEVWAPELIRIDGRWHIYFAASDGRNRNHRTFVLAADTDDALGPYSLHGPLFTGDDPDGENIWSIDFTVLDHGGRRYGIWSGWQQSDTDLQHLYAAELRTPTETTGGRVQIAEAGVHPWERTEERPSSRGLLEGPRPLSREGRTFLVYSCAASWLDTYKLGLLELTGDDPLDPTSWTRSPAPVFVSTRSTYGVGHGSFVQLDDGWWHVFHAKIDRRDGWRRTLHVQTMSFDSGGRPVFGEPLPRGQATPAPRRSLTPRRAGGSWTFGSRSDLVDFDYYGHHQYIGISDAGLDLGIEPAAPVNNFRSAEKVVLRDGDFVDVEVETTLQLIGGSRSMGVLVRTTGPAVGYDAQRGYFAGFAMDRRALVIGKTDGATWTTLGETPFGIDTSQQQTLTVRAIGDRISVESLGARLEVQDADYRSGSVGLRVVDTPTRFTQLRVRPLVGGSTA